jgi:hypothetical protein
MSAPDDDQDPSRHPRFLRYGWVLLLLAALFQIPLLLRADTAVARWTAMGAVLFGLATAAIAWRVYGR